MSKRNKWEAVLFDLDGTLIDTNELIMCSFEHVFETAGIPPWTREQMIPYMGLPLWEQLRRFSGREDVHDLVKIYRKFNLYHHDRFVRAFPGLKETLFALHQAGVRLGVVTSKMRYTSELGLSLFGVLHMFESFVTIEDVRFPKPHPEPVRLALRQMGLMPVQALMVGDSPADLMSANAAGVDVAAVGWSLKTREELNKHRPTFWLETLQELVEQCRIE
jgi:pyrophosphatase PpaX